MPAVVDHHGPFWIGTRRNGKLEEWANPFTAPNQDAARSVLETLGMPHLDLLGPFPRRSDALGALPNWQDERLN